MLLFINFLVSFVGLAIAAYTDKKEGLISNQLVFAMGIIGLSIQGLRSYYYADPSIIIATTLTVGIVFICSFLFWKLGVWGGGDVKLFTALALLNPVDMMGKLFIASILIVILNAGATYIISKKLEGEVPFVPAMLAAYIILVVSGA